MPESLAEARAERDEAMSRAVHHADKDWLEAAWLAVTKCAQLNVTFITDEVWGFIPEHITTHDPRAMGPIIKRAQSEGLIEKTDTFEPSIRRHASPQRVWRSLAFLRSRTA